MTSAACPGCGKQSCPQFGDECWRNNGCPSTPPDRTPEPDRGHSDTFELNDGDDWEWRP